MNPPPPNQATSHVFCLRLAVAVAALTAMGGCDDGAPNAQRELLRERVPRIKELIGQDRTEHRVGIQTAARRLAPGFVVADPGSRERQMRVALRRVQELPRGIQQLVFSPKSFLAAIDRDGVVIARDTSEEHDRMKGDNFADKFPAVRRALEQGEVVFDMVEFKPPDDADEDARSSYSMMFVAPARHGGEIVGAVALGIPLWREAQRLSRQLRLELAERLHEDELVVWVYMYKGDELRFHDTPPDLDEIVPDGEVRRAGLSRSAGGFTGQLQLFRSWYGYAVIPIPTLGDDVGIIAFQSEKGSAESQEN